MERNLEDERMPKPKRKTFLPPAQREKKRKSLQKKIIAKWRRPPANRLTNDTILYVRSCLYQLEKFFFSFCRRECNLCFFCTHGLVFLRRQKKWEFVSCTIIIQQHLELKGNVLSKLNKITTNAFDFPYMPKNKCRRTRLPPRSAIMPLHCSFFKKKFVAAQICFR